MFCLFFQGAAMATRERTTPAVAKGTGFWHAPIAHEYSQETRELLKGNQEAFDFSLS